MVAENADRSALLEKLGVDIDPELLELALTHRSYAYEHGGIPNNERLEFLGDSILGQAVTVKLFRENPHLDEGELAKRRASLVSSVALAEVARSIGLGEYLQLGRGENQSGGREKASILADTVEALIGATYLDAGGDAATALVLRLVEPLLGDPEPVRRRDGPEDQPAGGRGPPRCRAPGLHRDEHRARPLQDLPRHCRGRRSRHARPAREPARSKPRWQRRSPPGRN